MKAKEKRGRLAKWGKTIYGKLGFRFSYPKMTQITTYKKDITASGITFSSPLDSLRLKISLHPLFFHKVFDSILIIGTGLTRIRCCSKSSTEKMVTAGKTLAFWKEFWPFSEGSMDTNRPEVGGSTIK